MARKKNVAKKVANTIKNTGRGIKKMSASVQNRMTDIDFTQVIKGAMQAPLVRIDRSKYLHKELIKHYPEETVKEAIDHNPAYAGIRREHINKIAKNVINYEANKVTAISFAAGLPGGVAMAATIPADITQYFGFILRVMQKLAYLYGFDEFEFKEEEISDETLNRIMVFLGVMFGVQGANAGVKIVATAATKKVSKTLAQKALTKTTVYPIVKKIAQAVGIRMTKQIFAESVSKIVPVIGGIATGGLTYLTFKPCSRNLQKSFMKLNISDPEFYRKQKSVTEKNETEYNEIIDDEEYEDVNALLIEECDDGDRNEFTVEKAIELYRKDYDRPVVGYWVDGEDIILNVKPRIPEEPAQWIVKKSGLVYNTNPLRNAVIATTPMKKLSKK